jgi:hypothetical protein
VEIKDHGGGGKDHMDVDLGDDLCWHVELGEDLARSLM